MSLTHLTLDEEQWVRTQQENLTLEQKVGQLFCPTMMSETLNAEEQLEEYARRLIREIETYELGGYYLNRYYLPTTPTILNRLQERSPVPLLICADMESGAGGGLGGAIAPDLVTYPPAMGIGATGSEQNAFQAGRCTAWQARSIGVNFVFAPSLDVNINPDNPIINIRSFGEDPELVARLGCAVIRGLQEGGVAASAKHFPGHGDTCKDSHLQLGTVLADRERLDSVELLPFRRAIAETDLFSIMTAHLSVPALEPDPIPATFSSRILQNLLREEWGFTGVIVTDALLMGAITNTYNPGEAAVRALQAGADILLMPPDLYSAYQSVLVAVKSGTIAETRLDESVSRILAMKAKLRLHEDARADLDDLRDLRNLNNYPMRISYSLCDGAVTLVKNENHLLPLDINTPFAAILLSDTPDDFYDNGVGLFDEIHARTPYADCVSLKPGEEKKQLEAARSAIEKANLVVFGLIVQVMPEKGTVELPEEYAQLVELAIEQQKSIIMISFGNPYLIRCFPAVQAYLCAYHYFHPMVSSVAEVLFGERVPQGKLPIRIPGVCEVGTGLQY